MILIHQQTTDNRQQTTRSSLRARSEELFFIQFEFYFCNQDFAVNILHLFFNDDLAFLNTGHPAAAGADVGSFGDDVSSPGGFLDKTLISAGRQNNSGKFQLA